MTYVWSMASDKIYHTVLQYHISTIPILQLQSLRLILCNYRIIHWTLLDYWLITNI